MRAHHAGDSRASLAPRARVIPKSASVSASATGGGKDTRTVRLCITRVLHIIYSIHRTKQVRTTYGLFFYSNWIVYDESPLLPSGCQ